jgi:hypothetical protein
MSRKQGPVIAPDNSGGPTPRLGGLIDALKAQDHALTELTDLAERQGDAIGGVSLVLRALLDLLLSEEQRAMLEAHLELTAVGPGQRAPWSIVDTLLD